MHENLLSRLSNIHQHQKLLYAKRLVRLAGNSDNAAYLANVCVAEGARRQGVGGALIQAARQYARTWGECPPFPVSRVFVFPYIGSSSLRLHPLAAHARLLLYLPLFLCRVACAFSLLGSVLLLPQQPCTSSPAPTCAAELCHTSLLCSALVSSYVFPPFLFGGENICPCCACPACLALWNFSFRNSCTTGVVRHTSDLIHPHSIPTKRAALQIQAPHMSYHHHQ